MSTSPSGDTGDVIEEIIQINATEALEAIANLQAKGQSLEATIKELAQTIQTTATETGVSVDVVSEKFQKLLTGVGLFGAFGDKAGFKEVNAELGDMAVQEEAAANSGLHLFSAQQLLNTVMGTFVAMGVFQVMQFITTAFNEGISAAHEYYQAVQNITVAQDAMARGGVNVTNQQLLNMADQLSQKFGTFAKVDMTTAVSQAALLTSNLHLSVDQVQQLAEMAALLAREHGGMPQDYVDNLVKAASGTNALWANQMGIAATSADILAKAKELNLVSQDAKSITDDNVKAVAGLALEWDKLGPQEQKVLADNSSMLVQSAKATADWKNAITQLGNEAAPIWTGIQEALSKLVGLLQVIPDLVWTFASSIAAVVIFMDALFKGAIKNAQDIGKAWQISIDLVNQERDKLTSGTGGASLANTPVNPSPATDNTQTLPTVGASDLNSVENAYQTYYNDMQKAAQEFNNRMADLQSQYEQRVQNEISDTNLRILQEQQNYHLRQQEEAQNFQQKMKDLQDQYLLDLQGALRKRDAEQVITDIEKYQNQVAQAKSAYQIQQEQAAAQEKLRIEQMKQEEALRLQQMAAEYQLQRQNEIRNYQQQQQDLTQHLDQTLQEEAVKLADKYNLNQGAATKLYDLFEQYYGPNGSMVKTQQNGYLAMEQNTANMIATMQTYVGQYAQVVSVMASVAGGINQFGGVGSTAYGPPSPAQQGLYGVPGGLIGPPAPTPQPSAPPPVRRQAQGGIDLAQTATTVTYGEAGPELAMFLPLNASQGKVLAATGLSNGAGTQGGLAQIEVALSPDLEARIVNNTLNAAAITIKKVYGAR